MLTDEILTQWLNLTKYLQLEFGFIAVGIFKGTQDGFFSVYLMGSF